MVAPAKPTPRDAGTPRELPLSPLDLNVRGLAVHWGFMYDRAPDPTRLRAALSEALVEYPVLAGRVRVRARARWRVTLDDAGVSWTVRDSSATLPDVRRAGAIQSRGNVVPPDLFTPVHPRCERGGVLVAVRLTRLADGAAVVALSWSHVVADGRAMHAFVRADREVRADGRATQGRHIPRRILDAAPATHLANAPRPDAPSDLVASAPVSLETASAFASLANHPRLRSPIHLAAHLCGVGWRVAAVRLSQQSVCVGAETLASMRRRARRRVGFVSENDVAVAFAWTLFRRLGRGRPEYRRRDGFAMQTVECRGMGAVGLEPDLFGNASLAVVFRSDPDPDPEDEDEDAVADAAAAMAASVRAAVTAARGVEGGARARREMVAMARAGFGARVRAAVAAVGLSDAFHSSWLKILCSRRRSEETPSGFWGAVYPRAPWTSCVVSDGKGGWSCTSRFRRVPRDAWGRSRTSVTGAAGRGSVMRKCDTFLSGEINGGTGASCERQSAPRLFTRDEYSYVVRRLAFFVEPTARHVVPAAAPAVRVARRPGHLDGRGARRGPPLRARRRRDLHADGRGASSHFLSPPRAPVPRPTLPSPPDRATVPPSPA